MMKLMNNEKALDYVESIREDFIRQDEYPMFLFNPEWIIMPTIVFIDGVPFVQT
jgi:hypothetical protein